MVREREKKRNGIRTQAEYKKHRPQHGIKKIGQVSAKPNVSGLFTRSPNLLIWLLEKKNKNKMQKIWLVDNPKGNCLFTALLLLY